MTVRELADDPITFDHDAFTGIVADAVDGRLNTLNTDTTSAADLEKELQEVAEEAETEVGKLAAAKKRYDDAVTAEAHADGAEAQRAAQKEMREANAALIEAQAEYDLKETEILAKLLDILTRAGLLAGGTDAPLDNDHSLDDPTKPKSEESPSDKPSSDEPASDSPGDSPSSDSPSDNGQTQLSSDTSPTAQQPQQQQAQAQQPQQSSPQQQQQQPSMSPSSGMPQQSPNVSPSAFNVRPRDRDKDKPKDIDADRDALPVAAPVPVATSVDRGTSASGTTTRDISGKPTALSTSGQVPGAANANNVRGGGPGGGMMGGGPIGGGNKADTSSKRSSKRFDLESLFTKPDDDDQRVNSGALSKDSLAATEKEREDEQDRMQKAMRDSVKRIMDKKAG